MRVVYADSLEAVSAANSEHHLCCKKLGNCYGGERDIVKVCERRKENLWNNNLCKGYGCVASVLGVRFKSGEDFSGIYITCAKGKRIKKVKKIFVTFIYLFNFETV